MMLFLQMLVSKGWAEPAAALVEVRSLAEAVEYIADKHHKVILVEDVELLRSKQVRLIPNEAPLSPDDEWDAFCAMFQVNGFEVVEVDQKTVRVVDRDR